MDNIAEKKPDIEKRSKPKKKESFIVGLFSLMTKQCISSGIIFALIYGVKISKLPFSENICLFIKNIVGFEMTGETLKNLTTGLFS